MDIILYEKLPSTNTYVKQNIEFLFDKSVVIAETQLVGRGRFERRWVDVGPNNAYMTFVLKPASSLCPEHANLTQYLSVILCKQLESMGLSPQIKWPNDVLLNGKKVSGILAESSIRGGKLIGIALGIGVNLNVQQCLLDRIDRPATSVNLELGHAIDKHDFRKILIDMFFESYDELLSNGFEFIRTDYERYSLLHKEESKQIKVAVFNRVKEGIFAGFDSNGNLLLKALDGKVKSVNMGEIVE